MPLKPSRRLPKKFSRLAPQYTKKLVAKKHKKNRGQKLARLQRKLRGKKKQLSSWLKVLWRTLLVATAIGATWAAVSFFFSPYLHIQEIKIQRTEARLDVQEVQHILTPLFHRHIFSVSDHEIRSLLVESIPDIASIDVSIRLPQTLIIQIDLQDVASKLIILDPDSGDRLEPIEIKQQEEENTAKETGSGGKKPARKRHADYMTADGIYILDPLTEYEKNLPIYRIVDWGARPTPSTQIISKEMMQLIKRAERVLTQQFQHTILRRTVYLRAREIHLTTEHYTLWFDLASPFDEQILRYRTLRRVGNIEDISDYIDLRLRDRIIYK